MTWQTIAAWVGAVLGILNFIIALLAKRPIFTVGCRVISGEAEAQLRIANITERPLLIRGVRVWPTDRGVVPRETADLHTDPDGTRRFVLAQKGRFLKVVQPTTIDEITLLGLTRGAWCLVLIRWSQQRPALPWSLRLITRGHCRDIFDAVNPPPL